MHIIRWNELTERFEIVILGDPCPDGTCEITGTIHIFPAGTDNATACAAYDQWRETGELPGGVTTA